jgi:hypothetical protein
MGSAVKWSSGAPTSPVEGEAPRVWPKVAKIVLAFLDGNEAPASGAFVRWAVLGSNQ